MNINLADKPIVITGASSGIGYATAIACARAGMPVVLMARRADRLETLKNSIESQGGRAITYAGAVESTDDCQRCISNAHDAFGSLYAVFANAGYGLEKDVLEMTEPEIRDMFEVNFFGSLNIIRPAHELFRSRGTGHIIFCSSCISKIGLPRYACYAATKACQDYFGRAMRHELAHKNIHVSTIHPIRTTTELFDMLAARSGSGPLLMERPGRYKFMVQTPERVANAIVQCLRKPRGEVWTSTSTRLALALALAMPGLTDRVLGHAMRRHRKRQGISAESG